VHRSHYSGPLKHILLPAIWRHLALGELAYRLMKSVPGDLIEEGRI